jgi:riboflavin kinase/FMN adenylyltransferase
MSVWFGWPAPTDGPTASVVTAGVFDGFHRGHRALVRVAVERGQALTLPTVMVTFDPHPRTVLRPDQAPRALLPVRARIEHALELGVHSVVVLPFDTELASQSAEDFVDIGLIGRLGMRSLVVGGNFRCGSRGRGDLPFLRERGKTHGYDVTEVPLVRHGDLTCSSTEIRRSLAAGDTAAAHDLLGRTDHRIQAH